MRRSFVRRWRSRRRSRLSSVAKRERVDWQSKFNLDQNPDHDWAGRLGDEQYSIRLNLSDRSRRVVRSDKTVAQVGEVVALSGRLRLKLKPQRRDAVTVTVWTVRSDRREVKREDEEKRPTPLDAKRGLYR